MTADVELLPLGDDMEALPPSSQALIHAYARANVTHATAAKDAEIEALRTEVAEMRKYTVYERMKALETRAERLAEALRIAIRQNSHDMLMTGDELRQCESALHPTAAQGHEAASA